MSSRPVVVFAIASLAISWTIWLPLVVTADGPAGVRWALYYAGVIGPAAAAFLCAGPRRDVLLRRIVRWRVGAIWYGVAILLPFVMHGLAVATRSWPPVFRPAETIARVALLVLLLVPFEEIGWRGYALPLLQQRYTPLVSSLIVAGIWALWHLPLAWASVGYQRDERPWSYMLRFAVTIVPISCLATWLFNRTGESVPIVSLFHAAVDVADFLFVLPSGTGVSVLWTTTAIASAIVGLVWWRSRGLSGS